MRNVRAVLLAGNEPRFLESAKRFQNYLVDEARLPRSRVRVIPCAYKTSHEIDCALAREAGKARKEKATLVVAYDGHGEKEGMRPNGSTIPYSLLAEMLKGIEFIFINVACFAGSAVKAFEDAGLLPKKGLLIAASEAGKETRVGEQFLDDLMRSLRSGRSYRKRTVRRLVHSQVMVRPDNTNASCEEEVVGNDGKAMIVCSIPDLLVKTKIVTFRKPRQGPVEARPVRCGKQLDHLLFAEPRMN